MDMVKKRKTPLSEKVRENCTIPAKKAKKGAIEKNRPVDAMKAGLTQTQCEILEDSFKEKIPTTKKRKVS